MKKFDGENLFSQNDIDGQQSTKTLNYPHLKAFRFLRFAFRLYDFRHTFATRALESKIDLLTLALILEHANLKVVFRYAHSSEKQKPMRFIKWKTQK